MPDPTAPANRFAAGRVNYTGTMSERPRYYANDHSRDVLALEEHTIPIEDARYRTVAPSLQREGFALVAHTSAVKDFRDAAEARRTAVQREISRLRAAQQFTASTLHSHRHQRPDGARFR